ncbi:hypothetical protein NL676_004579 [Syzygium grande]|nr:hypothetical protein NL676_004579 [Syzygium grande]
MIQGSDCLRSIDLRPWKEKRKACDVADELSSGKASEQSRLRSELGAYYGENLPRKPRRRTKDSSRRIGRSSEASIPSGTLPMKDVRGAKKAKSRSKRSMQSLNQAL